MTAPRRPLRNRARSGSQRNGREELKILFAGFDLNEAPKGVKRVHVCNRSSKPGET